MEELKKWDSIQRVWYEILNEEEKETHALIAEFCSFEPKLVDTSILPWKKTMKLLYFNSDGQGRPINYFCYKTSFQSQMIVLNYIKSAYDVVLEIKDKYALIIITSIKTGKEMIRLEDHNLQSLNSFLYTAIGSFVRKYNLLYKK